MRLEAFGEFSDDRVVRFCREGGHVQSGSHGASSAGDGPLPFELSAVSVERGQSGQGGRLLSIDLSEFGKFGNERGGGDIPDAGHAAQNVGLFPPLVVRFDEGQDFFFKAFDFFVERVDDQLQTAFDRLGMGYGEAVFLGGAEHDQLSPPGDELVEFALFFVDFGEQSRFHLLPEAGNDGGVDAVGFGEDAKSLGEVSDLPRIDDGNEVSRIEQIGNEQSFVSAGGFDDEAGSGLGQVVEEFLSSFRVV